MQLQHLVEEFIADVCAGKKNETPLSYRRKLKHLLDHLGFDYDAAVITPKDIEEFRKSLLTRKSKWRGGRVVNEPLSLFTVRTVLITVRYLFGWASGKSILPTNPALSMEIPSEGMLYPKATDTGTIEKLLESAAKVNNGWESARDIAIICLLRDTGGRIGGLINAHVGDLDLQQKRLKVLEKGDRTRTLYLSQPTITALREWLHWREKFPPKDEHLFLSQRTRRGITRQGVARMLSRLAERAGIHGRVNPHSFRHAFARDTLRAGADLSRVSRLMGHSNVAVTARYYACWDDTELQELHSRVSPGKRLKIPKALKPATDKNKKQKDS